MFSGIGTRAIHTDNTSNHCLSRSGRTPPRSNRPAFAIVSRLAVAARSQPAAAHCQPALSPLGPAEGLHQSRPWHASDGGSGGGSGVAVCMCVCSTPNDWWSREADTPQSALRTATSVSQDGARQTARLFFKPRHHSPRPGKAAGTIQNVPESADA